MYDVIVVGGGPAGLQAALTLGRMHQSALVIDSGQYRNEAAHRMHNFATNDGTPPADFRASARKEIAAYETVEIQDTAAARDRPGRRQVHRDLDGGDRVRRPGSCSRPASATSSPTSRGWRPCGAPSSRTVPSATATN